MSDKSKSALPLRPAKAPSMEASGEAISPWTWLFLKLGLACVLPCSFWTVGMETSLEAWMRVWGMVLMNRGNWACLPEPQPWAEAVATWSWVEECTGSLYLCHSCHQGLKSGFGIPRNEMGLLLGGSSNLRGPMSKTRWVSGYFGKSHCRLMTLRATALTPCHQMVPGNPTFTLSTSRTWPPGKKCMCGLPLPFSQDGSSKHFC